MKKVKVYNASKNRIILGEAEIADTFFTRFRGLLGRKGLAADAGLIINPCNSVHMIGMRFPIDVIFVNRDNRICHIQHSMRKMSVSPVVRGARFVIEAPEGISKRLNIEMGDEIKIMIME
ncbi:DUF192 domain-containing protein [Anaerobium acetethylicum]|uniref:DUF192 domain-containing protein n=1 Tax=Anaerobium acetethylicum TaxID=1619234 RepID=A0A1D3TV83_9FIRM|nr:DUF192 domain-containing protein [Anaerobium acetethylicum]SCP98041.1 hypothetical protein SAMN05421730_101611 [Anaerobium acetethylicum]